MKLFGVNFYSGLADLADFLNTGFTDRQFIKSYTVVTGIGRCSRLKSMVIEIKGAEVTSPLNSQLILHFVCRNPGILQACLKGRK
jgi:hypothetical protein